MQRTSLTRLAGKESTDRAALDRLLDEVWLGHVAIVRDGAPLVVPTAVARWNDRVLFHGSTGSPWMRAIAVGADVCLTVTAVDAVVVARSAFESSVQYRSAVLFGTCRVLAGQEKVAALDVLVDRLIPGRVAEVRASTAKELAATVVLALPIEEWSLKVSVGWPDDAAEDLEGPSWAGIVPVRTGYGDPIPAPDLRAGIPAPDSVATLARRTVAGGLAGRSASL
ncbi:MAG TPA: pyridoxamine 5'-phosphate oxidase family protein [Microlunatus sp.]|nr:pyridoxamine 5'-phosphate oxidase family protein [Microlunatus sp.]